MPNVFLIGGHAGSGKTELSRALARLTGWALLDKDTISQPLTEAALIALGESPVSRESKSYRTLIRPREYEALLAAMYENLRCGVSTIAAAPFLTEFADSGWVRQLRASCAELSASLRIVWVHCDPETMQNRIKVRNQARDSAKLSNWDSYLAGIDLGFRPATAHDAIDNSASSIEDVQSQARALLTRLRND
jgi:predicted kinase